MEREHQNVSLNVPLIHDVEQNKSSGIRERTELIEEVIKQLWLAGPLISVSLLNYSLQIISIMFVGHLGELALSGASMATSFASVTGFSLLMGMASALDTLCGQSYGAKQHRMLGIQMQRAMFVLMIVSIPLAVMWANTKSILILFGQDHEIATAAGNYAQLMVPSIFAYGLLQCLNRFLQTQNLVFPMVLFSGVTSLLHILLCWLMVFKSGLGGSGAAVANSISYWLNVVMLTLYVRFSPSCSKTWTGFSKEALQNIPQFLMLAIPSAVMVCFEMWSFELMVLLSGLLPNPKLETSVLSICLNTSGAVWMIPFGLSGAISTRISNELGAGHPKVARLAVVVVLGLTLILAVSVGTVMILIRNVWGYAYSNEVEVVKYVAIMMPILAISSFLEALQSVLSGVARGCGWQKIGAYVNLGSYYLVGIPAAVVFAFVLHIGGKGLWLGIICAVFVQSISLSIITIRTNWEQEAKKATDRVYDSVIIPDSRVS
ncbi:PREDICTED: protein DETOXIFICATION 16-like isoform X2 [Lupinus angustifolius]|uniref:protein DETOXIFICATION 16-like isoform X2 n=1 Tax=Lupinus angustifolius TaxID=3871 RepID=UPI00092FAAA2|nr:PREDICTED: protein DETOXIFICATION 16-like isoform X2 [Lupinus angustifolius]